MNDSRGSAFDLIDLLIIAGITIASVTLFFLLSPALWDSVRFALDVRQWSRRTWFFVNLAVVVVLLGIRLARCVAGPAWGRCLRRRGWARRQGRRVGATCRQAARRDLTRKQILVLLKVACSDVLETEGGCFGHGLCISARSCPPHQSADGCGQLCHGR